MADISKIKLPSETTYDIKDTVARNGLIGKQDTLVSGTNIKTINNQSLLGSGNIPISSDGNYFIDIDNWTSQDYVELEDAIRTGKYLYIGQEDEQSGEIFHSPVTCSMITEDSEIICYYIEDDTVHMYTFHSDGTYYYEYHYLQRKLTAGNGIEINSSNVISATGTSYFYKKDESTYTTSSGSTITIPVGITGFRSTDILMVDINGLSLVQGTDYTISGTNIVLTTPITHAGAVVHFTAMRIVEVTPQDYAALKGDTPTMDSSLSSTSENGVQNKVLKTALDDKVDMTTPMFELDTTVASGTIDGDLRDELQNLGWLNDVVESAEGMLVVKKLFTNLLDSLVPETINITSLITPNATNASITDARMTRVGRTVYIFISGRTKIATTAGTEYQICTLDSSLLPTNGGRICVFTTGIGSIQTTGGISYRPTVNMASGNNFYMSASYVLADNWQG